MSYGNINSETFVINTCSHDIGDKYIIIDAGFGAKRVIINIDIVQFRKIMKSLQKLDEDKNE